MPTITRAQLAALTELHRIGEIRINRTKLDARRGPRRATLAPLPLDGLMTYWPVTATYTPALTPWADGFGNWHVNVPAGITNGRAVARAVIAGEVWARESQAYIDDWQPRLERVAPDRTTPAGTVEYRETAA